MNEEGEKLKSELYMYSFFITRLIANVGHGVPSYRIFSGIRWKDLRELKWFHSDDVAEASSDSEDSVFVKLIDFNNKNGEKMLVSTLEYDFTSDSIPQFRHQAKGFGFFDNTITDYARKSIFLYQGYLVKKYFDDNTALKLINRLTNLLYEQTPSIEVYNQVEIALFSIHEAGLQ